MVATFEYDPTRAQSVLERFTRAADDRSRVAVAGDDWAQVAMGALLQAEFLAADAGIVPYFQLPDGSKGILTVGAAREKIDSAPDDVRTIYLATHSIVRSTHAMARPATSATHALGCACDETEIGILPVWIFVVLGVAAIIATATYFIHRDTIEVESRNLRATAAASTIAGLAREQLAQTGRIDPDVWQSLRSLADGEHSIPWVPLAVAGIATVGGVGGILAWRHFKKNERGRRGTA